MLQYNTPNKVAVVTSYPPGICPIATFSAKVVENMLPASYGAFEPVLVAVEPEMSRDYPEEVNFVIRKNFRSDYAEAADFINAGHGDVVIVQHHFDIFGNEDYLIELTQNLDIPILATLHSIVPYPPARHYKALMHLCDVSGKVIVINKTDFEVLNKHYKVPSDKIELIGADRADNPFERDEEWFQIGRHYWRLVSEQLHRYAGDLRSFQAENEQSVLFGQ